MATPAPRSSIRLGSQPCLTPKILHYCWYGRGTPSSDMVRCRATWDRVLAAYEQREWNEDNTELDNDYLREAYAKKLWSKVANLIRLRALLDHGGVYLDTDVEVRRPLDDFLGEGCVVAFQHTRHDMDWVANAVIIAKPGHPFLKDCVDFTLDHFRKTGQFLRSPSVTTAVLREWGLVKFGTQRVKDVLVLEPDSFYSRPFRGDYDPLQTPRSAYCVHHWHHTWRGPAPRPASALTPVARCLRVARQQVMKASIALAFPDSTDVTGVRHRTLLRALAPLRTLVAELAYWRRYRLPAVRRWLGFTTSRGQGALGGSQLLMRTTAGRVASGPFTGLRLIPGGQAPLTPQILGTYERELHPWIDRIVRRRYRHLIGIGRGGGYYAVGLAVRCPDIIAYTFAGSADARRHTSILAALNRVQSRIDVRAGCSAETLDCLPTDEALVICEVGEDGAKLLDLESTPSLAERDLLIAIHDDARPLRGLLTERLAQSHVIESVTYGGRSFRDCVGVADQLSMFERQMLVEEYRAQGLEWLFLRRKGPLGNDN